MHNQEGGPTLISDETCLQQIEKHNTKEWHHRSLRKEIHCYHEIRWSLRWRAYQFRAQVWAHILIIILGDPLEFPQKSNFLRRTCNDHLVSSPHTILPLVHFNLSKKLKWYHSQTMDHGNVWRCHSAALIILLLKPNPLQVWECKMQTVAAACWHLQLPGGSFEMAYYGGECQCTGGVH